MPKTVDALRPGESGYITGLGERNSQRSRLLDMGLVPGSLITVRAASPFGDPVLVSVRGCELALRREQARSITVRAAR